MTGDGDMQVLKSCDEVRRWIKDERIIGRKIGLVPTMGYLHDGHLRLVRAARKENEVVVMSIFVNPLQFGPQEDFRTYPRDLERDVQLAEEAGVDIVFVPAVEEMYPQYPQFTSVNVAKITEGLCGASRPGHFTGVATVVAKLFNIVMPDRAYFGQKDYQQVQVIKRMAADLNFPIEIKTVPIKREVDGLAMSSRNFYLSKEERKQALSLYDSLMICKSLFNQGEKCTDKLIRAIKERIEREPDAVIDYIQICATDTLEEVQYINGPVVALLAVRIGKTRLIDNLILGGRDDV
jgi:pantoate--beta-alanine ligase